MNEIKFKDIIINLDEKVCIIDNKEIPLTKTEWNMLLFLINNKNKILSRGELMVNIWNKKVDGRYVNTVISRLRKKLPKLNIITRSGFGYYVKD